jgi:hypothetical protein
MSEYRGRRGEALVLNHFINSIVVEEELGDRLSSLVSGSPPIWVTKRSGWLYFSQARALERNIKLTSDSGEEQRVFIIDSVLEPLLTNSIRNSSFNQGVTAGKLLARSGHCVCILPHHHAAQDNAVRPRRGQLGPHLLRFGQTE